MTTKDFIKMLQEADPSGTAHIRMEGGVPISATLKEGYWDGPYSYIDKDKWVYSSMGTKVDINSRNSFDHAYDIIERWNPFKEPKEDLWEKAKETFVFNLGSYLITDQQQEKMDRFLNEIKGDFHDTVYATEKRWKEYLEMVIALNKRGCRFFRKKKVEWKYYSEWKWINEKSPKDIGQANLMHTFPILESGKFESIPCVEPGMEDYYEYKLIEK